ncbi:MAG: branched-chain amino acid ABC transporter permease [Candidatus Choladocola sp.]|nr:branched-chain amino acid ABC transporter permease [Candidatus Choladocola sp.]
MLKRKKNRTPAVIITVLCILTMIIAPNFTSTYTTRILSVALINYLCVLSVYVLLGMCGQNSFAQAGFWGIGAYLAGNVLTKSFGGSITAFIVAVCGTALLAFVLGFAFFRLRQYYFTFASIGLMTILNVLFINWADFSGGALGMKEIPTFRLFGISADGEQSKLYVVFAVCLVATMLVMLLFNSSLGRSFMAIRDNEMTADSLGINSLLTKSIAFAISGALCGAAGAMWASVSGYLSYQSFTYNQSTIYLIMIMIGGTGSPIGALIGTAVITLLQEGFRSLQDYMQLIYGFGVIVLMIVQPEGIWGGGKALYERIRERRKKTQTGTV